MRKQLLNLSAIAATDSLFQLAAVLNQE